MATKVPGGAVFVFAALLSPGVNGQTPVDPAAGLKGLGIEQLGDIEVTTVSRAPVKVSRTPAAIYVITQDDIHRSGATTIPEAFRLAPGVEVARIDSVKWAIGIRGFQSRLSRDILVLFDGRSVYDPLFHGVYWETQDTLLEDIDRIEVIRGPGGTIWGANAVDGVINVITKNAKDTHGQLISAGGGTVNQGFVDAREGGSNGKGLDYRFYLKGTTQAPESHPDGKEFDDWRRTQGGFRADWTLNDRDSLTVQGDIYDGLAGESIKIASLSAPYARIVDKNAQLSGGNIVSRWVRKFSDDSDIQIQSYYDRVNRLQAGQAEYRNTFDFDLISRMKAARGEEITWGLGARISLADLPLVVPTYVFSPNGRTDQVYTGFVQDEIPFGAAVSLTVGSKLLHSSFSGFNVEPSVRLLWTPSMRQSIWGAVTRAVRTPSDIEDTLTQTALVSTSPLTFSVTGGDGKFTSETMLGYEIGYRDLITQKISIDIATFYNRYDHLLSSEPGIPYTSISPQDQIITIDPYINGNGLRGTTKGFEIVPNWKPFAWWRLEGSWAYLNMHLATRPDSLDTTTVTAEDGASPRHELVAQSWLDLPGKFQFSQAFRYVSALAPLSVRAYETADARLSWQALSHTEFSVTGQNLFQARHVEYNMDPNTLVAIKRSVYAAIAWRK